MVVSCRLREFEKPICLLSRISIAHLPPGRIACAHSRSFRMFGNISHQEGHTLYYHEACVSTRGFNEANTVFTADTTTTTVTTKR